MNRFLTFTGLLLAAFIAIANGQQQSNFQINDLMVPGPDGYPIPIRLAQQMAASASTTTQPPKPIYFGPGYAIYPRSDADNSQAIYQGPGYAVYPGQAPGALSQNDGNNKNNAPKPIETDGRTYAIYAKSSSK